MTNPQRDPRLVSARAHYNIPNELEDAIFLTSIRQSPDCDPEIKAMDDETLIQTLQQEFDLEAEVLETEPVAPAASTSPNTHSFKPRTKHSKQSEPLSRRNAIGCLCAGLIIGALAGVGTSRGSADSNAQAVYEAGVSNGQALASHQAQQDLEELKQQIQATQDTLQQVQAQQAQTQSQVVYPQQVTAPVQPEPGGMPQ
jgi:hypothetical protein